MSADAAHWTNCVPHGQPDQIAYIVDDLAEAIAQWTAILGRADWSIYTYGPENVEDLEFRGMPGQFSMRLALCGTAPQVELIQSLRGPNLYTEHRELAGPGLHHVGYFVDSIADLRADLAAAGQQPVQVGRGYGLDDDGGFAYYELPDVGLIEYIEAPKRRRPSELLDFIPSAD